MNSEINPTFELKGRGTTRASGGVDTVVVSLNRFYLRHVITEAYVVKCKN